MAQPRDLSKTLHDLSDRSLFQLRVDLEAEMTRRGKHFSIGGIGETLAVEFFNATPGLPTLLKAPAGTKNVDCLSRDGDRYSVKTLWKAKKTGTVYPDSGDREKQLFEYLLVVRLTADLQLAAIHRLTWQQFVNLRSWDRRMSAWYLGCSSRVLGGGETLFPHAPK